MESYKQVAMECAKSAAEQVPSDWVVVLDTEEYGSRWCLFPSDEVLIEKEAHRKGTTLDGSDWRRVVELYVETFNAAILERPTVHHVTYRAQWVSADPTLTVPVEIHLYANGFAVAVYAEGFPVVYESIDALTAEHQIEVTDSDRV